ncbi:MAG: hypothetical protein QSU88_06885, partial [Candidatus Methanoperedens sp.]|nr:hypothetical protein [Candidatus Methanoperedens sp.]
MPVDDISRITSIDPFFIRKIRNIIDIEDTIKANLSPENLRKAKRMGLSDERIAFLTGKTREEINDMRRHNGIVPTLKMVDTCA